MFEAMNMQNALLPNKHCLDGDKILKKIRMNITANFCIFLEIFNRRVDLNTSLFIC